MSGATGPAPVPCLLYESSATLELLLARDHGHGKPTDAIVHYTAALRLKPESPVTLNNLAWLRATAADPALRDGAAAVRLAERAADLTGRRLPGLLDTLAAAYAEAGRWPAAVATAEQALALAAPPTSRRWRDRAGVAPRPLSRQPAVARQ